MRIAVLVFGRLGKGVDNYNNIIESLGKDNILEFFAASNNSPQPHLDSFIELYKPILYTNDPVQYTCNLDKYPNKPGEIILHNVICQFINKSRVFSLLEEHIKKENIKYDVVVSLRLDVIYHNKFDYGDLADNTIYIPHGHDYFHTGINDQVAWGVIEVMQKYNSIFSNTINLIEQGLSIPHPESLNLANLLYHKINIQRVNLSHIIVR
jgi:hypothetical protein